MNIAKYFWDFNEKALRETKKILKDANHPKFVSRMIILLSRCDKPKELFTLISKREFIEIWPKLNRHWLKVVNKSDFREWWQTIYEQLLQKYKEQQKEPKGKPSILFIKIGGKIKQARIQKGLSQKKFASMIGMKQPDISKIEKGQKNITLETLIYLAKALNIKKLDLT